MANMKRKLTDKYLDLEIARSFLNYDPDTGQFTWKVKKGSYLAGSKAGSKSSTGHILIRINYHNFSAHRLAWLLTYGSWPSGSIDHANGDPSDNRISNLRECSHAENMQNMKRRSDNQSGYTGVSKKANGYSAEIKLLGVKYRLGYFKTAEEAYEAYLKKKRELHQFQPTPRNM